MFLLVTPRPPISTRTYTPFPYTTLCRSCLMLHRHAPFEQFSLTPTLFLDGLHLGFGLDAHARQRRYHVVLVARQHVVEHAEGFALVLLLRILLRITAQMDALPQIVHRGQMFAPQ